MLQKIKSIIRSVLPNEWTESLHRLKLRILNFGRARYCPCCQSHVRQFERYGVIPRPDAYCPVCSSLERHRLITLYFRARTNLFDGSPKRLLHIAPEAQLARIFSKVKGLDYLSADLSSKRAMVKMDITNIQYPDDSFDIVYCSHVLEHVPDDRRAMSEFYRVLKPGGWAILQVPLADKDVTYEDFSISDPVEREKHFGQHDHVRWYGRDYTDRLVQSGFEVVIDGFVRELDPNLSRKYGLMLSEDVYMCRKKLVSEPANYVVD